MGKKKKKKKIGFTIWDTFMQSLRLKSPYFWGLYRHYRRHRFFYRDLQDAYVNAKPGFIFLLILCICFLIFFVILIPIFKFFFNFLAIYFLVFFFNILKSILFFSIQTADFGIIFLKHFLLQFFTFLFKTTVSIQLMPEIILLCGVVLVMISQPWAIYRYNSLYFKRFLVAAFGVDYVLSLSSRSQIARMVNQKLLHLKKLFVIFSGWNIALVATLFSFFWLVVSSVDLVRSGEFVAASNQYILSGMNDNFFGNHFFYDAFTFYSKFFILLISIIFLLIFKTELETDPKLQRFEFTILFLLGVLFSSLMVSASSLLSLFLVIEGLVMVMYILNSGASLSANYPIVSILRPRSIEGSLKYIVTNAVAGSFFLIGSSLLISFTNGEIYFLNFYEILNSSRSHLALFSQAQLSIAIGLILIALTFLFKIGSFPFHSWMADLYEGSNLSILSFFVLVPKMAILFTIINLQRFLFFNFPFIFFIFFISVGLVSLVAGAVLASRQNKISRLIAYSSVSQVGSLLILLALVNLNPNIPYALAMIFIVAYGFVMAQFMSILSSFKHIPSLSSITLIKELSFIKTLPSLAQNVFATFVFNLAGMPPFLGWLLKSIVILTSLLLTFDSILLTKNGLFELFLSNISNLEMSFLSFLNSVFYFNQSVDFSMNLIFLFFIVLSFVIFLSLIISVHYSIQLYKVTFSELNSVSFSSNDKMFISHTSSVLCGSLLFALFVINFFSIFSIVDIFGWVAVSCFGFIFI